MMPKAMPAAQSTPMTVSVSSMRRRVMAAMARAAATVKTTVTGSTGRARK